MQRAILLWLCATLLSFAMAEICTSRVAQYEFDGDLNDAAVLSPGTWVPGSSAPNVTFGAGKFGQVWLRFCCFIVICICICMY
jgi:hypothetical protein